MTADEVKKKKKNFFINVNAQQHEPQGDICEFVTYVVTAQVGVAVGVGVTS